MEITVDRQRYKAHRLAWLYMTGAWPKEFIDHINGNKTDNAFRNLRDCSRSENAQNRRGSRNSKSGVKGVFKVPGCSTYRAYIEAFGKIFRLGSYPTLDEARAAYNTAAAQRHGEFARFS